MYLLGKMEILPLELFSVVKATTNSVVCPSAGLVQIVMWMVTQLVDPPSSLEEERLEIIFIEKTMAFNLHIKNSHVFY